MLTDLCCRPPTCIQWESLQAASLKPIFPNVHEPQHHGHEYPAVICSVVSGSKRQLGEVLSEGEKLYTEGLRLGIIHNVGEEKNYSQGMGGTEDEMDR